MEEIEYEEVFAEGRRIWWNELCGNHSEDDAFWSDNVTLRLYGPDVTLCFQNTVLVWIPCIYLWSCSLVWLPCLIHRPRVNACSRISALNLAKLIFGVLLCAVSLVEFIVTVKYNNSTQYLRLAVLIKYCLQLATSILATFLIHYEYRKGVISGGVLFFYWLIQLLLNMVVFRSNVLHILKESPSRNSSYQLRPFYLITFFFSYALLLVQFCLTLFADVDASPPIRRLYRPISSRRSSICPRLGDQKQPLANGKASSLSAEEESKAVESIQKEQKMRLSRLCPEIMCSFLSRLTFFWISNLIVQGYRRILTGSDLWELRKVDRCSYILPRFEQNWKKELERFRLRHGDMLDEDDYLDDDDDYDDDEDDDDDDDIPRRKTGKSLPRPSLWKAVVSTFAGYYLIGGFYKLLYDLFSFISPLLLSWLIEFVASGDKFEWRGYLIVAAMFIVSVIRTVIINQYYHIVCVTGQRLRTAVVGVVYRKSLRLNSSSRRYMTVGDILNLMSVDAQKLQDAPVYMHMLWSTPLTIGVAVYLLWQMLGPSVLAGIGSMLLVVPINGYVAQKTKTLQGIQMKYKDMRIKLMTEILNGIKVLKLYSWEDSFRSSINHIREKELKVLRTSQYLSAATSVSWFMAPYLVALGTFTVYVLSSDDHVLDASKAFVSLSLFNILNYPLSTLPVVLSYGVQAAVSMRRIGAFLLCEEVNDNNVDRNPDIEAAIEIKRGTFSWSHNGPVILRNINLAVPGGGLVAVVGQVGAGKSSVIAALCGEMEVLEGSVGVKGSVAYVPQQAWIQNASIRDNILFSKEHKDSKYQSILEACALVQDLQVLPNGDLTEVGEKDDIELLPFCRKDVNSFNPNYTLERRTHSGISLSGGQKQRISLARAVYENADVYLLDDPLSAVDSHVGKHIFDKVISSSGLLKYKTRVLVTNSVTYLHRTDLIVVMRQGQISEIGTYQDLLSHNGAFAEFVLTYLESSNAAGIDYDNDELRQLANRISVLSIESNNELDISDVDSLASTRTPASVSRRKSRQGSRVDVLASIMRERHDSEALRYRRKEEQRLRVIEDEGMSTGNVKMSVFGTYLKACRLLPVCMTVFWYMGYLAAQIASNVWLSIWSTDTVSTNHSTVEQYKNLRDLRLGVYGGLGVGQAVGVFGMSFSIAVACISSSRILHQDLLRSLLRAPMSFYDTTPLGRIMNRFSRDVDMVDMHIPLAIRIWLGTFSGVFTTIFVIVYSTPVFLIVVVLLGIFYYFVQRFYISSLRQLRRIDSVLRSPIYVHFSETLSGVGCIRAFRQQQRFVRKTDELIDNSQMSNYPIIVSARWLGVWLELIGSFIVLFAGLFAVLQRDKLTAGLVGLSVSYALQVTGALNNFVRITSDLESYIVSVERMNEYANCPKETVDIIPQSRPPRGWPSQGRVEFKGYSARYRDNLDLVLHNICCTFEAGEKIGIVGRTGSGKSSLTLALFRMIEATEGSILIDGVDISNMGLRDLRAKLTIIPQDPVLFAGTLRMNLDPFHARTDEEIWKALELSHLQSFVTSHPNRLMFECSEGGENLSVGQRQLVCLARALLRKSRILVMDEATAAVDLETDDLIQRTIRKEFGRSTVITIAHRLNTIMDYNRVLVLDKGRVAEFDDPLLLLQNKSSLFHSMAKDSGLL